MLQSFFESFFNYVGIVDYFLWSYIGVPAILLFGVYFAFKSRCMQVRKAGSILKIFLATFENKDDKSARGISPVRTFFTSIGGCVGVGNVVSVCTAVQIGGPGAIFWMWVAAIFGMLVKYSEIYLGVIYRVPNQNDSYDGGPMYYLYQISPSGLLSVLFCIFMCIYGAEIYVFRVVTHTLVTQWGLNKLAVVLVLLSAILVAGKRGFDSVGKVVSVLIPGFVMLFMGVCAWVFIKNYALLPHIFMTIFKSAFSGHALIGAFAGSTVLLGMAQGMKRACYTGDIGIGYASIIHAESNEANPKKEAVLGMMGIFLDTFFVCTLSVLLIIVTGLWSEPLHESQLVVTALSDYIPAIRAMWPLFITVLGYSTLISYYSVGKKAAKFLFPNWGQRLYMLYAICAFLIFSFVGNEGHIMTMMSTAGVILLIINMYGILRLRNKISFDLE